MLLVNIRWRSMRVNLIYSLCLACRARRGRWIIYWFLAFLAAGGLAFVMHPVAALLLLQCMCSPPGCNQPRSDRLKSRRGRSGYVVSTRKYANDFHL